MWQPNVNLATNNASTVWDTIGKKSYELNNHLGNVVTTISDGRTSHTGYFTANIKTAQDYYAFGALMPSRTFTSSGYYRYGFNGKENDNEVKGTGNQQDYGQRIYDPRVGRFLSVDPIAGSYPWYTPYSFAGNKPIWAIDLDGEEEFYYQLKLITEKSGKSLLTVQFAKKVSIPFIPDFLQPDSYRLLDVNGKLFEFNFKTKHDLFKFVQDKTLDQLRKQSDKETEDGINQTALNVSYWDLSNDLGKTQDHIISSDFSEYDPKDEIADMESVTANAGNIEAAAEPQLVINKRNASLYESKVKQELEKTQNNVQEQVTIKTKTSRTRIDFIGIDKETGEIVLTEAKASENAPLTKNQKIAHPEIAKHGGKVVGKGKPGYSKGTKIPVSKVNVKRPK